jgi:hypothetical protein
VFPEAFKENLAIRAVTTFESRINEMARAGSNYQFGGPVAAPKFGSDQAKSRRS